MTLFLESGWVWVYMRVKRSATTLTPTNRPLVKVLDFLLTLHLSIDRDCATRVARPSGFPGKFPDFESFSGFPRKLPDFSGF